MKSAKLFSLASLLVLLFLLLNFSSSQDPERINFTASQADILNLTSILLSGDTLKSYQETNILLKNINNIHKFSAYSLAFLDKMIHEGYKRVDTYRPSEKILDIFPITKIDSKYYIGALLKVNNNFKEDDLLKYQALIGARAGDVLSIKIPIEYFANLSTLESIDYIDVDKQAEPSLDKVREFTLANYVHLGYQLPKSLTGKNVVIGIIDTGFDFTHYIFWDTTLTRFRIKKVWDMSDTTGPPPKGFRYGTEVVGVNNIIRKKYDVKTSSHGTHVAGIASGGYSRTYNHLHHIYKGIAPESDLIIVATLPSSSSFADAIKYIFNYADSLNKPCVLNFSWGSLLGPRDGTSPFDQAVDALSGRGRIIVGSAGNSGSTKSHISKKFSLTDTALITFLEFPYSSKKTNGNAIIDIWSEPNKQFKVYVGIYNINSNQYEDAYVFNSLYNMSYQVVLCDKDPFFPDSCLIVGYSTEKEQINGKPHILLFINNSSQDDSYKYILIAMVAYNTTIHGWASGWTSDKVYFESKGYNYPAQSGDDNYTVNEIGGTARSIISVGAYTTKNSWQDITGASHQIPFYASIGEIAPFSSKGPTTDGRIKPDITAPGNVVVSSINRFDENFQYNRLVDFITDSTNNWWFGVMEGTSMSAPVVTGVVSLLLEANPNLDPNQIKQIFQRTAIIDGYTGVVPNNTWGWGKVNAYEAVKKLVTLVESAEDNPKTFNLYQNYPNPFNSSTTIEFDIPEKTFVKLTIYDALGREITTLINAELEPRKYKVNFNALDLPSGVYFYRLKVGKFSSVKKMILLK